MGWFDSSRETTTLDAPTQQGAEGDTATNISIQAGDDLGVHGDINVTKLDAGAIRDAFTFAGGAFDRAISSVDEQAGRTAELTSQNIDALTDQQSESLEFVESSTEQAFLFSAGAFTEALDAVQEQSTRAVDTAVSATKSEAERGVENVLGLAKTTVFVLGAIGVAVFVFSRN